MASGRSDDEIGRKASLLGPLGPAVGVISMARSRWSLLGAKSDRLPGFNGLDIVALGRTFVSPATNGIKTNAMSR